MLISARNRESVHGTGNQCTEQGISARNRDTAVPAEGNGDLQTLICVLVVRPRRCLILSNPVPWQNWMAAYLGYTLRMKTLFRGWPVMVNDTHTRRRRRSARNSNSCARKNEEYHLGSNVGPVRGVTTKLWAPNSVHFRIVVCRCEQVANLYDFFYRFCLWLLFLKLRVDYPPPNCEGLLTPCFWNLDRP